MQQTPGQTRRAAARALSVVLDASLITIVGVAILIAVTGGGILQIGEIRIRARTVHNPIWIASALLLLRYSIRGWSPFLGLSRWPVRALIDKGHEVVADRFPKWMMARFERPVTGLLLVACAACAVKLLLAWTSPGFFSGDDVEIHEMTMASLYGRDWPVWQLRSAFFPMLVVYPAQRLALALGGASPDMLVFSGRAAVAVLSTLALPLTWLAARRLVPGDPRVAALAVMFLAINKLQMSFGSSELPRPVATVFVVAAFLSLLRGGVLASMGAGALLGIAASFRFSEVVFLPAAVFTVASGRRWTQAAALLATAAITLVGITAAADALYWGRPLASLTAMVDYTLVQRGSSRGFEPPWEYLKIIPAWTTLVFVALAIAGSSRRHAETWWIWTPILLLSLLPHKEGRYLIPVIPFFSIAVARGFLRALAWIRGSMDAVGWRRWVGDLFAPAVLLAALHDVGGWRLARSNEGVRLAKYLALSGPGGVSAQDIWPLGGRIYLAKHDPLVALPPDPVNDPSVAAAVRDANWVVLRSRTAHADGDALMSSLGFRRDEGWQGADFVLYLRQR